MLKCALMDTGLNFRGTLEESAQTLFSTKVEAALDPNLLAKKNQRKAGRG